MPSSTTRRGVSIDARRPEIRHLWRYCTHLKTMLENAGYHVVDSQTLEKALNQKSDQALNRKVKGFRAAGGDNDRLLNDTIQKRNAFAYRPLHLIGVPECRDLVAGVAMSWGLNSERLKQAGICDMHIYSAKLIHEASHVMGPDGRFWEDPASFEGDEPHTYLNHMTRFMRTTGFNARDSVPNFLADLNCINNTIAALRYYESDAETQTPPDHAVPANEKYKWTYHASQWAITRANKSDPVNSLWSKRADRFHANTLKQHFAGQDVRNTGMSHSLYERARLFLGDCIRKTHDTDSKGLIEETADLYELRDIAWQAGRNALEYAHNAKNGGACYQKGGTDAEKAALILRQLARSIDHIKRYADDYKPPANGARITHRCPTPGHTPG